MRTFRCTRDERNSACQVPVSFCWLTVVASRANAITRGWMMDIRLLGTGFLETWIDGGRKRLDGLPCPPPTRNSRALPADRRGADREKAPRLCRWACRTRPAG